MDFALIQLCTSSLLMAMQLATLPVLLIYEDIRQRILYRIMLSIALSDSLQLYAIWQFTLFQCFDIRPPKLMEKLVSGIYIVAWDHLIIQHFLLALNRLVIIFRAYHSPNANKSRDLQRDLWLFNSLLLVSWLLLAGLVGLFMTPFCEGHWDSETVGFFYNESLPTSGEYRQLELYFTVTFPALSIACYAAIVLILKKMRFKLQIKPNASIQQSKMALNSQEKRILLLSIFLFSTISALIFAWYNNYRSPPWTMMFCGYLLVNTSLNLAMNSEYRKRFLHMLASVWIWKQDHQQSATALAPNKASDAAHTNALFVRRNQPK